MATSVSPGNNLSQTLSFERRNSFRDPSFSSYLSSSEENDFIVKLTESTKKESPLTMIPQGRVKDKEDEEIGVFGAEKYFKGELEEESTRKVVSKRFSTMHQHQHQNESSQVKSTHSSPNYLVSANMCTESQIKKLGTRSARSESSVNSRSVLLHRAPRNREHCKGRYVKNFLASLGCNCNNKAAVEVDKQSVEKGTTTGSKEKTRLPLTSVDLVQEVKSIPWAEEEIHINLRKEDCFSFPVLNSHPGIQVQGVKMLNNWDLPIPKEKEIVIPSYGTDNDAESNASSDLFELESFSTNGMSSCVTPITCYAPSEASIEWSVVTARAAEYSAFPEGITGKPNNLDRMVRMAKIGKNKKDSVMNGGGRGLGPVTTKYRPEITLTGSDSARGHLGFSNCSLPRSHC